MRDYISTPTFRLFALPSLWEGVGSVIDLFGSSHNYNYDSTPKEADRRAMIADVDAMYDDFQAAIDRLRREIEPHEQPK